MHKDRDQRHYNKKRKHLMKKLTSILPLLILLQCCSINSEQHQNNSEFDYNHIVNSTNWKALNNWTIYPREGERDASNYFLFYSFIDSSSGSSEDTIYSNILVSLFVEKGGKYKYSTSPRGEELVATFSYLSTDSLSFDANIDLVFKTFKAFKLNSMTSHDSIFLFRFSENKELKKYTVPPNDSIKENLIKNGYRSIDSLWFYFSRD
jgi:hypothetical protein